MASMSSASQSLGHGMSIEVEMENILVGSCTGSNFTSVTDSGPPRP